MKEIIDIKVPDFLVPSDMHADKSEPWYAPAGFNRGWMKTRWWSGAGAFCSICRKNNCEVSNDLEELFTLFYAPKTEDVSFIEIHYPSKKLLAYIKGDILAKEFDFSDKSVIDYFTDSPSMNLNDSEYMDLNECVERIIQKAKLDPEYQSHLNKHEVLVLGLY